MKFSSCSFLNAMPKQKQTMLQVTKGQSNFVTSGFLMKLNLNDIHLKVACCSVHFWTNLCYFFYIKAGNVFFLTQSYAYKFLVSWPLLSSVGKRWTDHLLLWYLSLITCAPSHPIQKQFFKRVEVNHRPAQNSNSEMSTQQPFPPQPSQNNRITE